MTRLDHQYFKNLLFTDEPLTTEQSEVLKSHLQKCESCSRQEIAWSQVHHLIRTSLELSPAPGFTIRWQQRLLIQRAKEQHKKTWLFFLISTISALASLGLMGTQLVYLFKAPEQLLAMLLYVIASGVALVNLILDSLVTFHSFLPTVSITFLVLLTGFISLISVLWVVTFKQLSSSRRFIR